MSEMPITRFDLKGKWGPNDRGYGYNRQDIGILGGERGPEKIKQAWSNTKENFEVYFLRSKEGYKHVEVGEVTPEWVRNNLKLDIQPNPDAITIIFTNNRGANKIPMTAWMIAHRLGHAIRQDNVFDSYISKELMRDFREILRNVYGVNAPANFYSDEKQLRALAYAVGTMNSARNRNLNNFYEFPYELLAQYLLTGTIKFNPLPPSLILNNRMAWGKPSPDKLHNRTSERDRTEWSEVLAGYAEKYEHYFDSVLIGLVGKIFVM